MSFADVDAFEDAKLIPDPLWEDQCASEILSPANNPSVEPRMPSIGSFDAIFFEQKGKTWFCLR